MEIAEVKSLASTLEVIAKRLNTIAKIAEDEHKDVDDVVVPADIIDQDDLGPCDPGDTFNQVYDALCTTTCTCF